MIYDVKQYIVWYDMWYIWYMMWSDIWYDRVWYMTHVAKPRIKENLHNLDHSQIQWPLQQDHLTYIQMQQLRTAIFLYIPVQVWTVPEGSRRARLPECLESRHIETVKVLASHTGRLYSSKKIPLLLISVNGCVDPRNIVRPEGLTFWHRNFTFKF
jgi:hypothetical protein